MRDRPWPGRPATGRLMVAHMDYFIYILKSIKDGRHYVGMTCDLEKRLKYHNSGKVRSTKNRVPFKLLYSEKYLSRLVAREREKYLKSYKGSREKLTIIEHCGIV